MFTIPSHLQRYPTIEHLEMHHVRGRNLSVLDILASTSSLIWHLYPATDYSFHSRVLNYHRGAPHTLLHHIHVEVDVLLTDFPWLLTYFYQPTGGEISVHSDYGSALQTTCTCSRRLALLCFFLRGEFAYGLEPNAGRPSRPSSILTRLFYCIATKHYASGHHSSPATTPTSRDGPSSFSTLFCILSQTRSGTSKPQSTIIKMLLFASNMPALNLTYIHLPGYPT